MKVGLGGFLLHRQTARCERHLFQGTEELKRWRGEEVGQGPLSKKQGAVHMTNLKPVLLFCFVLFLSRTVVFYYPRLPYQGDLPPRKVQFRLSGWSITSTWSKTWTGPFMDRGASGPLPSKRCGGGTAFTSAPRRILKPEATTRERCLRRLSAPLDSGS